jgi:hypothetical protein
MNQKWLRVCLLISPLAALTLWAAGSAWLATNMTQLDDAIAEQQLLLSKQLKVLGGESLAEKRAEELLRVVGSGQFIPANGLAEPAAALQTEIRRRVATPGVSLNSLEPLENITVNGLEWTRARLVLSAPNAEMLAANNALDTGQPIIRIMAARVASTGGGGFDQPMLVADLIVQSPVIDGETP